MEFSDRGMLVKHAQIARFFVSGGTAFSANLLALYVITEVFGLWYLASSTVAFLVAFSVSFSMQKYWTFRDRETRRIPLQMSMSFVVAMVNLGLNSLMMYLFVEYGHLHYLAAQVGATGIIAIETYFIYKHLIFGFNKEVTISS